MLTTKETAERLGITVGRVRQMVISGQLPSEKFGRDLMIAESDLALVSDRKAGRPKKEGAAAVANGATGAKTVAASQPTTKATKKGGKK